MDENDSATKNCKCRARRYALTTVLGICWLACYLLGIDATRALRLSSFRGRLVETYIHNEIRKSFLNCGEEAKNMFYYRDSNQNEIDLILVRDGTIERIECKSGKKFDSKAIKGFSQIEGTNYEFGGSCPFAFAKSLIGSLRTYLRSQ